VGSELTVTACTFDNAAQTSSASSHEIADIYLGSLEPVPDRPKDRTPDDPTDDHPANAHLTVTHCVSSSVTFLVGDPAFASEEPGCAVLSNVLHQPRPSDAGSGACSILWGGRYEPRSLVLQGCELGAPVCLAGPAPAGVVVELGTVFAIVAGERRHYVGGGPASVVSLDTLSA
jgi:hypothetical protein